MPSTTLSSRYSQSTVYRHDSRSFCQAKYLIILFFLLTISFIGPVSDAYAGPLEDTQKGVEALQSGDTIGAMRLFRKAAEKGYAPAQEKLAAILDRSEKNQEAFEWYQKAAAQNNSEGQYGLGMMYLTGDGIEKDEAMAVQLIEAAAQQELPRAMISMFNFYEKGQYGLSVDLQEAVGWLERLAKTGNKWAMELLANAYRDGGFDVVPDAEKAMHWQNMLEKESQ